MSLENQDTGLDRRDRVIAKIPPELARKVFLSIPNQTLNLVHGTTSSKVGESINQTGLTYKTNPSYTTYSYHLLPLTNSLPPNFLRQNISSINNCLVSVGLPVFPEIIDIIRDRLGFEVDEQAFYAPLFGVRIGKDVVYEYYKFPKKFVRGYWDVQRECWVDNPNYWENNLKWPRSRKKEINKIKLDIFAKLNKPTTIIGPNATYLDDSGDDF